MTHNFQQPPQHYLDDLDYRLNQVVLDLDDKLRMLDEMQHDIENFLYDPHAFAPFFEVLSKDADTDVRVYMAQKIHELIEEDLALEKPRALHRYLSKHINERMRDETDINVLSKLLNAMELMTEKADDPRYIDKAISHAASNKTVKMGLAQLYLPLLKKYNERVEALTSPQAASVEDKEITLKNVWVKPMPNQTQLPEKSGISYEFSAKVTDIPESGNLSGIGEQFNNKVLYITTEAISPHKVQENSGKHGTSFKIEELKVRGNKAEDTAQPVTDYFAGMGF